MRKLLYILRGFIRYGGTELGEFRKSGKTKKLSAHMNLLFGGIFMINWDVDGFNKWLIRNYDKAKMLDDQSRWTIEFALLWYKSRHYRINSFFQESCCYIHIQFDQRQLSSAWGLHA